MGRRKAFSVGPVRSKDDLKDAIKTIGRALGPKSKHAGNCLSVIAWPYQKGFCTCGIEPLPENAFEAAFDVGREYAEEHVGVAIDASKGIDPKEHSADYVAGWRAAMDSARDVAYNMPYGSAWYEEAAKADTTPRSTDPDDNLPF